MNDLRLWRTLLAAPVDVAAVLPDVRELAARPFDERRPFFGLLGPLLTSTDGDARRAAVAVLAGARGRPGLIPIVAALDDPDDAVKTQAVASLHASAIAGDGRRWVHAVFHHDPAVRRDALASPRSFPQAVDFALYLRADPGSAATVSATLDVDQVEGRHLPLLFDLHARAILDAAELRRLTATLTWPQWESFLHADMPQPWHEEAFVGWLDEAARPGWDDPASRSYNLDRLDTLVVLFWDGDTPEAAAHRTRFFALLTDAALSHHRVFRLWLAFTMLNLAVVRGTFPREAAMLVGVCHPPALACPWLSLDAVSHGLDGLRAAGTRTPRIAGEAVKRLLLSDLCFTASPDGSRLLRVRAAAGILSAHDGHPIRLLMDAVPLPELRAAIVADFEGAADLLRLHNTTPTERAFLIRELSLYEGTSRHRLLALIARAAPADALDFLDGLDGAGAVKFIGELLQAWAEPGRTTPSEAKLTRLADTLVPKFVGGQIGPFLCAWLGRPAPENAELPLRVLSRLVRHPAAPQLLAAIASLDASPLRTFLAVLPHCAGFPYDEEIDLARRLIRHDDDEVRTWATARLDEYDKAVALRSREMTVVVETPSAEPVLRLGLCERLALVPDPVTPDVETCQALLASHDPEAAVLREFRRYLGTEPAFLRRLDAEMVRHWRDEERLPFLGHAWLFRWDKHRLWLRDFLKPDAPAPEGFSGHGLAGVLRCAVDQPAPLARRLFDMGLSLLTDWRWHAPSQFAATFGDAFDGAILAAVRTSLADVAAKLSLYARDHGPPGAVAVLRDRLVELMPALDEETRKLFASWIDTTGIVATVPAPSPAQVTIVTTVNIDALTADLLADANKASLAAAKLAAMGEPGLARLRDTAAAHPGAMWPLGVLDRAAVLRETFAALHRHASTPDVVRYRVGAAISADADIPTMVALACADPAASWLGEADGEWLRQAMHRIPHAERLSLVRCPHVTVYAAALSALHQPGIDNEPTMYEYLLAFLESGPSRMREWRLRCADTLYHHGRAAEVMPVLLSRPTGDESQYPSLLADRTPEVIRAATRAVLAAGEGSQAEERLLAMLDYRPTVVPGTLEIPRIDPAARREAMTELLAEATDDGVRRTARDAVKSTLSRSKKLRRVAENFAWGVRLGRSLTGKLFSLEMIAGEDLGYTRLNENKLYISPMPLLRNHANARDVVRGLILHEFGHHLYHKGEEAQAVWKQADHERMHSLLNLVSDEHLERNLRVSDTDFGDKLHTLCAYAFQHLAREMEVTQLLASLKSHAFDVLTGAKLGVARDEGSVAIQSGKILHRMERSGMSFPRFMRAIRMGLGDRHDDPKVRAGLELFKGKFRDSTMPRMLEIAKELRKIFGEETDLLDAFSQDRVLIGSAEDMEDALEGISNEDLQAAIRRVLEEGKLPKNPEGGDGSRFLNNGPDEAFDLISHVVPKPHDPARHRPYADAVRKPAEKMRRFLSEMGLSHISERKRVQGRRLDTTRVRTLVTHRDPRVLIARRLEHKTDLFLGVVIDCSGSMSMNQNIEKAKLFGTLLAEASKGLPGIDVRLWGFTDRAIFDCGNAIRPAVHDLVADNGNNDAAALWHAAMAAKASRRRAKVLVMISDGSPTECTVAALRGLVKMLTRRMQILCAQVAVQDIEEKCFDDYILLDSNDLQASVRRFGEVMMKLVRRALKG